MEAGSSACVPVFFKACSAKHGQKEGQTCLFAQQLLTTCLAKALGMSLPGTAHGSVLGLAWALHVLGGQHAGGDPGRPKISDGEEAPGALPVENSWEGVTSIGFLSSAGFPLLKSCAKCRTAQRWSRHSSRWQRRVCWDPSLASLARGSEPVCHEFILRH